jgi:hypothetical protein
MRKSLGFRVHDDVDVALPPACDGLAHVTMRGSKSQAAQHLAPAAAASSSLAPNSMNSTLVQSMRSSG